MQNKLSDCKRLFLQVAETQFWKKRMWSWKRNEVSQMKSFQNDSVFVWIFSSVFFFYSESYNKKIRNIKFIFLTFKTGDYP